MMGEWTLKTFEELSNKELYDILQLRSRVFVVEQECAYQDIDGFDREGCHHLYLSDGGAIAAYTRLLAPDTTYTQASIGRVVTNPEFRQKGLGKELMKRSIAEVQRLYPEHDIKIGAQCYLNRFYTELGFEVMGDKYMEDGIEHVHMIYRWQNQ